MGRLTLNVLLSFAQFEREVTGERIRDKIAMSMKKGKWMGGVPHMGYVPDERSLKEDKKGAPIIRHIFERYVELKSVLKLKKELDADGYKTKTYVCKSGKVLGGKPFCTSHLYNILQNRVYIGEITHKGESYPGEHDGIIYPELFEAAQQIMINNRVKDRAALGAKRPCILAGKIFDDKGNYMSPKFSNSGHRHYRYYTSQAIIQGYALRAGSLPNIPAGEIEGLVREEITKLLKDRKRLEPLIKEESVERQLLIFEKAANHQWVTQDEESMFMRHVIQRIELSSEYVEISFCPVRLIEALLGEYDHAKSTTTPEESGLATITKDIKLAATNNGSKVIIGGAHPGVNMQLTKAIARSFLWNEQLINGEKKNIEHIAKDNEISSATYITRIMRLRFLAPDIIETILDGTHPVDWTVEKLFTIRTFDWPKQRDQLRIS